MPAPNVRMRFIARLTCIAVCGIAAAALAVGCGSGTGSAMPHLTTSVTVGPKPHRATINIVASGIGTAFTDITLTYPSGRREEIGTASFKDADSGSWWTDRLPNGTYNYTVYAIPAGAQDTSVFPASGRVDKNIVASRPFAIP